MCIRETNIIEARFISTMSVKTTADKSWSLIDVSFSRSVMI